MEPDKYQQAWQAQATQTRISVDAQRLDDEVRRSERAFRTMILWRDVREAAIALLLIPVWFLLGTWSSAPWTWYLGVPVLVWMAGFILVFRLRHPQRPSDPRASLLECAQNSLTQVQDQIWLLRNVFWWYLLPPGVSGSIFFAHLSWRLGAETGDWLEAFVFGVIGISFLIGVYGFVYYVNRAAIRKLLEPQRQELLALITGLADETTSVASGEYPMLMGATRFECSSRRSLVALLAFIAMILIALAGMRLFYRP